MENKKPSPESMKQLYEFFSRTSWPKIIKEIEEKKKQESVS
ncbi:hypothetical protein [Niallia sp. 03190]